MTLEQLRIFVEVAEREHLTQAAHVLALTPSAVSAAIRTLEEQYSTLLFNRVGRRIEISEAGKLFLVQAKATLATARSAAQTLTELGGLQRGRLDIHASQTIASYWLPPILMQFHQAHPMIELCLTESNTQNVAYAVLDGTADIGFVEGVIEDRLLLAEVIDHDQIVVVVAPGHPWADGNRIKPAELLEGLWVMREKGSGTRSVFETMLTTAGVDTNSLRIAMALPSNEAVRTAVMSGSFATVVSELVIASYLQAGLLCKVNVTLPPRAFYLLHHKERHKGKAFQVLEQMIRKAGDALHVS